MFLNNFWSNISLIQFLHASYTDTYYQMAFSWLTFAAYMYTCLSVYSSATLGRLIGYQFKTWWNSNWVSEQAEKVIYVILLYYCLLVFIITPSHSAFFSFFLFFYDSQHRKLTLAFSFSLCMWAKNFLLALQHHAESTFQKEITKCVVRLHENNV